MVGAGIGGLSSAIALAEKGWQVTVAELKPENTTVGVGINNPANALRALKALGVYDEVVRRGWEYQGIQRYTEDGELITTFEPTSPGDVPFQISMTRADLHDILTSRARELGARIELGLTWTAIDQHDDEVHVTLTDGTTRAYDLVVGADGIRSPLRRLLFGTGHEPRGTGYVCWRMRAERPEGVRYSQYFNGSRVKATVINLNPATMYLLVIERAEPGPARTPAELAAGLRALLDGFPGLIKEIRDSITPATEIHRGPLEEVELPGSWYRGRVVLIGDAAHAITPHLAQGAGMAMEDAVVLADELDRTGDDVPAALNAFQRRRHPRVSYVQQQAHEILRNEMESDAERKAAFAAGLGARQQQIVDLLAKPA
ncbi:FAD-dependent oxidoreductase [Amycolatopsis bartoniae]|uniref:FAD-dependent oxidoreductase n=1 Tax=Amycolatopsis bartoniae TaxID=941986 RepID=A0A8H9M308_9PSEU|nr:FAD-dependent oxidoreductase [Amycolatopsis bartoniae]